MKDNAVAEALESELAQMLADCPPFFRSPLRWLWNVLKAKRVDEGGVL